MDLRSVLRRAPVRRLRGPVDPYLGASRLCGAMPSTTWTAPAKGYKGFRFVGNVLSSRESMALALGTVKDRITELLLEAMENPIGPMRVDMPSYYTEGSIASLPIPMYYKEDGGAYITSGILHASFGGKTNLSFHRMMHLGKGRFAVRIVPRHLMALLREAEASGERLKATVSIGCDAASLLSASCTMGFGEDELCVASKINMLTEGGPLKVFDPDGRGTLSPIGSEVVLVGEFTGEREREGPFVDITSTQDDSGLDPGEPVLKVRKVLIRKDPIFHVLKPGGLEHYLLMGLPKEPSILQSVRKVVPKVRAVRLTEGGCCWLHGAVSIVKQKEGDGINAVMAAFSGHPSMKRVIVVDDDIDIFDDNALEWALATRFQADRGLLLVRKARGSTLDPSSDPFDGTTSKMGLDATVPLGGGMQFRKVQE